jgi:cystathionine beta-synthase
MRKYKISEIPVMDMSGFVGSDEVDLFSVMYMIKLNERPIREIIQEVLTHSTNTGTSIERSF